MAVNIGPFQNIVSVGWRRGLNIAVLHFFATWEARVPYADNPTLSNMPFGTVFPIFESQIKFPSDLSVSQILITPEMAAHGFMWSYPPFIESSATPGTEIETILDQATLYFTPIGSPGFPYVGVFTNSTVDGVAIAGAPFGSPGQAAAEYFQNQYNPMGGGGGPGLGPGAVTSYEVVHGTPDPNEISHEETTHFTDYVYQAKALVFFNLTKIKTLGETFSFDINTQGNGTAYYQWIAIVETFQDEKVFLAAPDNTPLWTYTFEGIAGVASPLIIEGGSFGAFTTTFEIDLTSLAVEGDKVAT